VIHFDHLKSNLLSGILLVALVTPAAARNGDMRDLMIADDIRLTVPEKTVLESGQGTDSTVGTIRGPGFECNYDLGLYSNSLKDIKDATVKTIDVSGRTARLVQAPPDFDGLYIPETTRTALGPLRLSITCKSADEPTRQTVVKLLRSVKIG
jgi:hypothetical protein